MQTLRLQPTCTDISNDFDWWFFSSFLRTDSPFSNKFSLYYALDRTSAVLVAIFMRYNAFNRVNLVVINVYLCQTYSCWCEFFIYAFTDQTKIHLDVVWRCGRVKCECEILPIKSYFWARFSFCLHTIYIIFADFFARSPTTFQFIFGFVWRAHTPKMRYFV